jgi:hypothetical protein
VIDSPATKSLNVATLLSVAAAAAPSVFTTVGLTASVPVFVKSVTSVLFVVLLKVNVEPEVITEVLQPVKVVPLNEPFPTAFPELPAVMLAKAAATFAAVITPVAVKVNPPIATV